MAGSFCAMADVALYGSLRRMMRRVIIVHRLIRPYRAKKVRLCSDVPVHYSNGRYSATISLLVASGSSRGAIVTVPGEKVNEGTVNKDSNFYFLY
jgi:hypothetical protein